MFAECVAACCSHPSIWAEQEAEGTREVGLGYKNPMASSR